MGKSSLINALVGQEIAIVSEVAGTTTDPVKKSIEIHGLGPLVLIDTGGIDDAGGLGELRIEKARAAVRQIDMALLVLSDNIFGDHEAELTAEFERLRLPYVVVHNKSDRTPATGELRARVRELTGREVTDYSAHDPATYNPALISMMREVMPDSALKGRSLTGDLIRRGDLVLLITPIDAGAPAGRLILPQVQVIRDILDNNAAAVVLKETEAAGFLERTGVKPALVITDSQIFAAADAIVPRDIPLTSFSIILARQKGDFEEYLRGTPKISELKDGDRVLMLESCTHNVSCDDIGRVKIPHWLREHTGKKLLFDTVAGLDGIPRPIEQYALVIQCGGCMVTHRQLMNRLSEPKRHGIPITNYGMVIAWIHGIFNRATEPFAVSREKIREK